MPRIRSVTTASGATAIQVVERSKGKTHILKHIGSGHTEEEVGCLLESAQRWLDSYRPSLFPSPERTNIPLSSVQFTHTTHRFAYDTLKNITTHIGFHALPPLLIDLAIMRLIEPSSKLRAIELLQRYFGISYTERTVYRTLPKLVKKKEDVETIAVSWAQEHYHDNLSFVLYDVTTLYFESFKHDEAEEGLRKPGFSKDNKSQQPQIVVGLLVTREGFPLGYEVFKGNTFEGKTMLTVLEKFVEKHGTKHPAVVADAAMLSHTNVAALKKDGYSYIVGARTGSLALPVITAAHKEIAGEDGATTRSATAHGDLILAFSQKRYLKDKREMDKQIARAQALVEKKEPGRRAKFVAKGAGEKESYVLNEALKAKTELLLGMKGYYTNIPEALLSNDEIIARYHDLWHVEAAFRMAKSDLQTRPIFHRTEDAVRAHVLVCFAALVVGRHMELSTGVSLRSIVDKFRQLSEAHLVDTLTGESFVLQMVVPERVKEMVGEMMKDGRMVKSGLSTGGKV